MSDIEKEPLPPIVPDGSNSDPYLAFLVKLISDMPQNSADGSKPNSVSLTVVVGGQMWTGNLVSAATWSSELASQIRANAVPSEHAELFAKIFDRFEVIDQETAGSNVPFGYIHLVSTVPVLFDGHNAVGGIAVRFRLDDVQGWTVGRPETNTQ